MGVGAAQSYLERQELLYKPSHFGSKGEPDSPDKFEAMIPERNYSADFINAQSLRTNMQTPETPASGGQALLLSPERSNPTYLNPPDTNMSINETGSGKQIHNTALEVISSIGDQFKESE